MKILHPLNVLFALLTSLSGCTKADGPTPDGDRSCLEKQEVPVSAHSINAREKATADQLFAANGIDKRNFRYTGYLREELKTYYPPYATFDEQVVRVEEYTNGLRIFTGQLNFLFRNGAFNFRAGSASGGTSLDATPSGTPESIGVVFRAALNEYGGPGSQPCVVVEFGYYNLNAGTSNASERLVKAWKASLKGSEYPFAYFEDKEGKLIYYDNGIRTFR
ncbi:hypothetical protein BEN47_02100 [Hymenobacter lapidarius]|uniref:FTP domain-containing protein n=1 Tax=Hymenobacter lapidarius TaxID=1908237 RepID=A0A1G1T2Q5_9BACT|nr:hypothetical protein [Hymenobacter lapidarius]OGX85148.1 hypothetical protein BEN47_02100 [Hymenobacter lapidarius]